MRLILVIDTVFVYIVLASWEASVGGWIRLHSTMHRIRQAQGIVGREGCIRTSCFNWRLRYSITLLYR